MLHNLRGAAGEGQPGDGENPDGDRVFSGTRHSGAFGTWQAWRDVTERGSTFYGGAAQVVVNRHAAAGGGLRTTLSRKARRTFSEGTTPPDGGVLTGCAGGLRGGAACCATTREGRFEGKRIAGGVRERLECRWRNGLVLTIRLSRIGKKKKPFYRVVVIERTRPRDGRVVDAVGTYDPLKKPAEIKLDVDRVKHWLSKGAQPSDTVRSFIRQQKIA